MNEKEYYGIYLNDDIPRLDKKNEYNKKVEICFEGKAYLIQRNKENEVVKTEIDNNYELKYEGDYQIEFTNTKEETYIIDVRISMGCCCIVLLFLLFLIGFMLGLFLCRPIPIDDSPLARFLDYINITVLQLDIKNEDEIKQPAKRSAIQKIENTKPEKEYDFDVTFENIDSDDIKLLDSISGKAVAKNKVAPGVRGCFSIIMNTKKSSVDMRYNVEFQDITKEKPTNMTFSVRGSDKEYSTLQELQKDLSGVIEKRSTKTIIIDWKWNYESGSDEASINENDLVDTNEGKNLTSYKFKILVDGEEVIE